MSSILTNNSAMVALQTLSSINKSLGQTQSEISTGKSVATAKDNSAIWAISKVMDSDVSGFKSISESLSLGESTVTTARAAADGVQDLLNEIKQKITLANGENVERAPLQQDIESLMDQIKGMVAGAQFNGQNLINGSANTEVKVLASLDRSSDGAVKAASIAVTSQNLSTAAGTAVTSGAAAGTADGTLVTDNPLTLTVQFADAANAAAPTGKALAKEDLSAAPATGLVVAGDMITMKIGDVEASYRVQIGDDTKKVNQGMATALKGAGIDVSIDDAGVILYKGAADTTVATSVERGRGDLYRLSKIDVTSDKGASTALSEIEGMIQKSIDAGASLGSSEKRISIQNDFVGKLMDSLTSGIGALVDANLEEASARLQALQVQQQLATQSLSIANQAPQSILALFR